MGIFQLILGVTNSSGKANVLDKSFPQYPTDLSPQCIHTLGVVSLDLPTSVIVPEKTHVVGKNPEQGVCVFFLGVRPFPAITWTDSQVSSLVSAVNQVKGAKWETSKSALCCTIAPVFDTIPENKDLKAKPWHPALGVTRITCSTCK